MPMEPFFSRFHDLAFREMRTLTLLKDQTGIPAGEYGLLELYCNELGCDCRRVLLRIVTPPPDSRVMATINFGWEEKEFYHRWGVSDPEARGPYLDPLNPQSQCAPALLELVNTLVLSDEAYVRRLARHYELFKSQDKTIRRRGPLAPMSWTSRKRRR